jgi:hypothetical protein
MISFDEAWYLQTYPEVKRDLESGRWRSAEVHYHQRGSREGKSPSAYFDEGWYRATYSDAEAMVEAGVYRSGLHHYLLSARREQRSPNALFDEQWYLRNNPDVASSVAAGDLECGFEHYLLSGEFEGRRPNGTLPPRPPSHPAHQPAATTDLFPSRLHVWTDPSKATHPRLNLVLPSLRMEHMSGGPNTALALICEVARSGVPCRLLSSDVGVEPDRQKLQAHIAGISGVHSRLDFEIADASTAESPAAIGFNDIFFATAWWTAQKLAQVLPRLRKQTFFYLIQDFEPGFYGWGTEYSLALETYDMDIIPVINSSPLRDHLVRNRIGRFADHAFCSRVMTFEPAIDSRHFHHETRSVEGRRRLLFYARPNIAKRNLFEIGLSALIQAVSRGALSPERWTLHFIGENLADTPIGHGTVIRAYPWLNFSSYARLMRQSDILLSLMLSPHPSYAPLEMAACGGIVVTNSYGCKTQECLSAYSPNILAPPPYAKAIASTLELAAETVERNGSTPNPIALPATWQESFAPIVHQIKASWESLQ